MQQVLVNLRKSKGNGRASFHSRSHLEIVIDGPVVAVDRHAHVIFSANWLHRLAKFLEKRVNRVVCFTTDEVDIFVFELSSLQNQTLA